MHLRFTEEPNFLVKFFDHEKMSSKFPNVILVRKSTFIVVYAFEAETKMFYISTESLNFDAAQYRQTTWNILSPHQYISLG